MMKQLIATALTITLTLVSGSCSETFHEDRYVIINVNYTGGPVDDTHRLWAVVFLSPNWTSELFRFSSGTNRIIIPIFEFFNLGAFTGFLAVAYDADGDGVITNERSIGYNDIKPTNPLTPILFLEIKTMVLDIDLDSANFGPFPY